MRTLRNMDKTASAVAPEVAEEQVDDALGQLAMQRLTEDDGTRIPLRDIVSEFAPELEQEFSDLL